MMLLRNFNRQHTVIRLEQFGEPKVAPFDKLELPRGSILHYIPTAGVSEVGPPQTLPMLDLAEKMVQVNHILNLTEDNLLGRPKRLELTINRDIMVYHRVNKRLRRLHNETLVERDDKTLLVENYAPLRNVYRYPQTIMAWYERFHNIFATMVDRLGRDADKFERQNYLLLAVPDVLPSIAKLKRAEQRRDITTLETFRDDNALFFLELWTWLGTGRSNTLLSNLTTESLKRINIVLQFNGKFVNLNLGELDFWRRDDETNGKVDPLQMQKRLYKTVVTLAQSALDITPDENPSEESEEKGRVDAQNEIDRSDADEDPGEINFDDEVVNFDSKDDIIEDDDFEIIKKGDTDESTVTINEAVSIDSGVDKSCEKFIEAGTLSTKEYQRVLEKAKTYKSIPNPFGGGTLEDMLTVTEEDVKLEETVLLDDVTLLDKSMAKSTTREFAEKYNTDILPKDIVSAVVAIQKAGVVVEDYRVEKVIDAANRLQVHTLKLTPVKGKTSTIRFTTPLIDEEGYWTANDIRYTMRTQRVDNPIRKTSPDSVALTTFYGKNFVQRSQGKANDYEGWLTNAVVAKGLDVNEKKIRNLKFANVFDPSIVVPRDYSIMATRLSEVTVGNVVYYFDASKFNDNFGEKDVKALTDLKLTPVGKSATNLYGMDSFGNVYKKVATGVEEMGSLKDVFGIDTTKMPIEYSELSMMGKTVPLAVIFAYYLGLENLFKEYKLNYRLAEAGEHISKEEGDLILAMSDGKYVLTFESPEQELMFNGLKPYLKVMRDFTVSDFNRKDVYLNVIQKDGLSLSYLNELDLMETMYVDPISERLLKRMGEPTHFKGLLRRANEMLTNDQHRAETDMNDMHLYGKQRIAGAIYTGLVRGVRSHNNRPGSNKKIDIPSSEIWSAISQDPSVLPASDANPMQSVKEADVVTFGGTNGRSRRSMVKRTRQFHQSDLGVISGDTVDSGDVGIISYMSANPILDSVDGTVKNLDRDGLDINQYVSSSVALSPGAMYDDDKRLTLLNLNQ